MLNQPVLSQLARDQDHKIDPYIDSSLITQYSFSKPDLEATNCKLQTMYHLNSAPTLASSPKNPHLYIP
jgi:hypothetical protein